jgi:phosphohistidine phosphatase
LSSRGRTEALDAAQSIADARLRCDALLVSPALRTRQTATIVAAQLDIAEPPRLDATLYLGDADTLLSALHHGGGGARTLLLVAHNPGISELARRFQSTKPPVELKTAGMCLVTFEPKTDWRELTPVLAAGFKLLN